MVGPPLREWIAPERTALLIVDMQADFANPDGTAGCAGQDLSAVPAAIANAAALAKAARTAGVLVIFVRLETSSERDSAVWAERALRRGEAPEKALSLCRKNTRGADFVFVPDSASDLVVVKHRYSAFFGTSLDAILKERGRNTLVVCGLTTECCVDSTVRDAFHRDFHVFLAGDACASYDSALHEAALRSLELNFAIVIRSDEAVAAWT